MFLICTYAFLLLVFDFAFEVLNAYITMLTYEKVSLLLREVYRSRLVVLMDLEEMQLFLQIMS